MRILKKLTTTLAIIFIIFITLTLLSGCQSNANGEEIERVGMLIENTIHDQTWGNKGYVVGYSGRI